MRNFKLLLAYDGSRYKGWQRLGDTDNTIQGKLENVLSRMVNAPVEVIGSGRTDAGAHAAGQTANFHADTDLSADEICAYLRQYLPEDIGVLSVEEVDDRFHSRFHAVQKTYLYRIWTSETPCVFERKYVWPVSAQIDLCAMRRAADYFLGTHDFTSFCSNKHFKKSAVRTIYGLDIEQTDTELRFTVTGDGFLYNMVRIMVGTLLAVGKGERAPEDIPVILESKIREQAGETVPAKGLCLMEVVYP